MDGLLEFMFDDVPASQVKPMIGHIVGSVSNIDKVIYSESNGSFNNSQIMSYEFWDNFCNSLDSVTCHLNIYKYSIDEFIIKDVSVMAAHYEGRTDIALIVSSKDCKAVNLRDSDKFYYWAKELASLFNITHFYGGLDPAMDEETQLYSNQGSGPNFKI